MDVNILTTRGIPRRNKILAEVPQQAILFNSTKQVNFLHGDRRIDQAANRYLLGRQLTENEKRCLISHEAIYAKSKGEWSVIIEDDAIIDSVRLAQFISIINKTKFKYPTILLLYIGSHGVFSTRSFMQGVGFRLHKCLALPNGAVAYAINQSAREIVASQTRTVGPADWPTWSRYIHFFGVFPQIVEHDFSIDSVVAISTNSSEAISWPKTRYVTKYMIFGFFNMRLLEAFGGLSAYLKINIYPAIFRRLANYFPEKFFNI